MSNLSFRSLSALFAVLFLMGCGDGGVQNSLLSDYQAASTCVSTNCGTLKPTNSRLFITADLSSTIIPVPVGATKIDIGGECNDGNYPENRIIIEWLTPTDMLMSSAPVPAPVFTFVLENGFEADPFFLPNLAKVQYCVDGRWTAMIDLSGGAIAAANTSQKFRIRIEGLDRSTGATQTFRNPSLTLGSKTYILQRASN